jgi:uncharacterized delta-60 repeat protein
VTTLISGGDNATAIALQPDGKIVVAGVSDGDFALARYLSNGTLDLTFGSNGTVLTDFSGGSHDVATALALQPDGKIVVAGRSHLFGPDDDTDFALARYLPNGTLDPTFGHNGMVLSDFGAQESVSFQELALQQDGKIVAAGGNSGFVNLARYRPNGTLDSTFGREGRVTNEFIGISGVAALAIQPHDGRLVVAGSSDASGSVDIVLARYHAITCSGVVVTQVGTAGNDTIVGTPGNDVIFGFGGNDLIDGLGGDDILCGGTGNDTLRGGSGNDLLSGGPGTDRCNGGSPGSGDTASGCERVTGVP